MTGRTPPHRIPRPRRAPGPRRWAAPELLRSGRERGPTAPEPAGERGASTVAMVGIIAVIGVLLAAVCLLGHVALCTHRAATAADLAALAAADTARGLRPGVACDEAARTGHNQYAPMTGMPMLREAIARKVEKLYGACYDVDAEITVTAGATQDRRPKASSSTGANPSATTH